MPGPTWHVGVGMMLRTFRLPLSLGHVYTAPMAPPVLAGELDYLFFLVGRIVELVLLVPANPVILDQLIDDLP